MRHSEEDISRFCLLVEEDEDFEDALMNIRASVKLDLIKDIMSHKKLGRYLESAVLSAAKSGYDKAIKDFHAKNKGEKHGK